MTIEIIDEIESRLRLRELGLKTPPLDIKDASLYQLDIEDSFLTVEEDPEFVPTPKPNPESEPE